MCAASHSNFVGHCSSLAFRCCRSSVTPDRCTGATESGRPFFVTDVGSAPAGCPWGDYDNDGHLDLFVANPNGQTNALYHNNGNSTFTRIRSGSIGTDNHGSIGCAWADYDNDGFLDLFVANGHTLGDRNFLYHNDGNSNAWINLKLLGGASNRSAIGAKVRVRAVIGGQSRWQMREVSGCNGFANQDSLNVEFGLGDAPVIDLLRIEWPSGIVQELRDIATRQFLTLTEPPRLSQSRFSGGQFQLTLEGGRGLLYGISTSSDLQHWTNWMSLTVSNSNGRTIITDPTATNAVNRFYRATLGN
jgi:hypothetical protein